MRIILSFLFCSVALQGMQPGAIPLETMPSGAGQQSDKPISKLVASNASTPSPASPAMVPVVVAPNPLNLEVAGDAKALIAAIDCFGGYSEDEITQAISYFKQNNPDACTAFFAKVASLKAQEGTSGAETQQLVQEKQQLTIDFLRKMLDYRRSAHVELQGQHDDLQGMHEKQIVKTTNANLRSCGAVVGGVLSSLIIGVLTWYLHITGASPVACTNASAP